VKRILFASGGLLALLAGFASFRSPAPLRASDHDDGETDTKGRNVNLTDLYVFKESSHVASLNDFYPDLNAPAGSDEHLVLVMNYNPRSLPGQQYYSSTKAVYQFLVNRQLFTNPNAILASNVTFQIRYGAPNAQKQQPISFRAIFGGSGILVTKNADGTEILSTPLGSAPIKNVFSLQGVPDSEIQLFAGHREDPFFFDVEQYFKVRAGAAKFYQTVVNTGMLDPSVLAAFNPPDQAEDFAEDYNVISIVLRVPIKLLKGTPPVNSLRIWETILYPKDPEKPNPDPATDFVQIERLGRPAINEGLIVSNDLLNAFNSVPPIADLSPAAQAVRDEAVLTLTALGNTPPRIDKIVEAFFPDTLRIDLTIQSGYTSGALALFPADGTEPVPQLRGGRLLLDDVVDATLGALVRDGIENDAISYLRSIGAIGPNDVIQLQTDNVSFRGIPGNPAQGKKHPLTAEFPYLGAPN